MTGPQPHLIAVTVNGERHEVVAPPRRTLSDVLRHDLGLTGTHVGCEHGICGACTVIVDGEAVRSCLVLAVQADDAVIETVEGLADGDGTPSPVQQAFQDHHAQQCGFCTPGFVMLATAILREQPDIGDDELIEVLASNLCRCTGYDPIIAAVRAARDGARDAATPDAARSADDEPVSLARAD